MVLVEFTKEHKDAYDKGDAVFLYDDENVHLSVTKDSEKLFSKRVNGKKIGVYYFSQQDREKLNKGEAHLYYDGKTKVELKLEEGVEL